MLRFPIPKPRNGDGSMLPAALTVLLAVMVVVQLTLVGSDDEEATPVRTAGHGHAATAGAIVMLPAAAIIRERPIFTPERVSGRGGPGGEALGGVQIAGAWAVGRHTNLVLREANGASRTIRIGQSVNQWTLASITPAGARFLRDGKAMTVPFGSSAPPGTSGSADATQQEEEGQ